MKEYELGQLIDYKTIDGVKTGTIFGLRKDEAGTIKSYLVDTGNDASTTEINRNLRNEEIDRRLKSETDKNPNILKSNDAINAVVESIKEQPDLPEDIITVEVIRQPEQDEVDPQNIIGVKEV